MGYDALGRRTSVTNSGNAFDEPAFNIYGYNARNELTASNRYLGTSILDTASPVNDEARAYDYDPIGNRINAQQDYDISASAPITSTYVTNSLNQYESITQGGSQIQLDYDDDGNLIHKDGVKYVFNCENRLVEVSPLTPTIGDTKVAFAYDYMGRRYLKQSYVYSAGEWSLVSTSTSLWEGWNRIQEKVVLAADSSEEVTSYVWGLDLSQTLQGAGGVGGLLAVVDADADVDFFLYDANGNVGQLISATDGTINAHYEYDPFGRLLKSTGSKANQNPYRFSTKPMDQQTGLYYYGYRYLDVDLGRWVNRDPIGERGGWNLYAFSSNSSNGCDALGLKNCSKELQWLKQAYREYQRAAERLQEVQDKVAKLEEDIEFAHNAYWRLKRKFWKLPSSEKKKRDFLFDKFMMWKEEERELKSQLGEILGGFNPGELGRAENELFHSSLRYNSGISEYERCRDNCKDWYCAWGSAFIGGYLSGAGTGIMIAGATVGTATGPGDVAILATGAIVTTVALANDYVGIIYCGDKSVIAPVLDALSYGVPVANPVGWGFNWYRAVQGFDEADVPEEWIKIKEGLQ